MTNTEFEVFSRKNFGQSPKRYQSDKYLWYFEWKRFQHNPYFVDRLRESLDVVSSLNPKSLEEHYALLIEGGRQLLSKRNKTSDPSTQFLIDETLFSLHFLLTMLIPEGYVLRELYCRVLPKLQANGFSFTDLLGGDLRIRDADPNLGMAQDLLHMAATLRNGIYNKLVAEKLVRDDYFIDRQERARAAIGTVRISESIEEDPIDLFYEQMQGVNGGGNQKI